MGNSELLSLSAGGSGRAPGVLRVWQRGRAAAGGYLLGYLPMALVGGWVIDHTRSKWLHALGLVLGTALCYLLGTAWFCWQGGYTVGAALGLCVTPFIPFDLGKIVIAIGLGSLLRHRLAQAGFYKSNSPA